MIVVLMFQISLLNTELVLATEVDVIHPVEDSETSREDTGKSDILGGTENNKTTAENSQSTSENVSDKFEVNETWKESREQRAVGDIIITGNAVYVITADSEVELYQAVPTNGAIVVPNIISNNGKDYIVTSISDQACVSGGVTSVTFPDSIVKIGNSAFGDNDLTNLVLPSSLKYIGAGAFDKNLLTNVDIPDGVTFIGQAAFYDNQLKSVTIPDSVTTMEAQAFQGNQLEHIRIPKGISVLEYSVFFDNKLTNIDIPDGVTTIGVAAFERNLLTNVDIPDSVTSMEEFAFYDNQLKSITIPDSVTTIGERAFQNNPDLLVYDIPTNSNIASVMSISGWGNAGVNSNATMTQAGLVRA
ncbi:leucine-rich repeat domain-containing protein, partial [Listeria innocua]